MNNVTWGTGGGYNNGSLKDVRLSITSEILDKILKRLPVVCSSHYEAWLFAAAFSMAYHGFLRVGEIFSLRLVMSIKY
jgi:hypothetical protein